MKRLRFILYPLLISAAGSATFDYRVLATSKTSTMEKEMNEAVDAGYAFHLAMGGETAAGGKEAVVVMAKQIPGDAKGTKRYRLLATARTSSMQRETQQAADEGFVYRSQTVFESAFGGREVAVIMERDTSTPPARDTYKLVATSRTSTLQKELREAGEAGFILLGLTVGKTALGGSEMVCILKRSGS